jgi:hypothetical protein
MRICPIPFLYYHMVKTWHLGSGKQTVEDRALLLFIFFVWLKHGDSSFRVDNFKTPIIYDTQYVQLETEPEILEKLLVSVIFGLWY